MGASAVDALADRVRRRLAYEGPEATPFAIAAAVRAEPGSAVLGSATLRQLTDRLIAEFAGAGPLTSLLGQPDVTDVLVNGPTVWIDRGRGLERIALDLGGEEDVRRLAQRLAAAAGRRLDESCPYVDAQLVDGTRLHAVLPPVARGGPFLSLRTFRQRTFTLGELVNRGGVDVHAAELLAAVVAARLPYVISGGTGSGKTTVLSALLSLVPPDERIVVVEDAAELCPAHPHAVALQARTSNVEGTGEVPLRELVRQALRMRPDRLVIGECRGAEVVDLLGALNTGHEGGAATLHANTPADVPVRLEALGLLGGVPRAALHAQMASALRVAVHLRRVRGGDRVVEDICVLSATGPDRLVAAVPAWSRSSGQGPAAVELARLISLAGVTPPDCVRPRIAVNDTPAVASAGRIAPARAVADHSVPGHGVPGHGVPGHGVPGHGAVAHAMPAHTVARHHAPGDAEPGHAVAGHAVAGHAVVGHAVAGSAVTRGDSGGRR